MDYTLHCEIDRDLMLDAVNVNSIEELINRVLPEKYQIDKPLELPAGVSEQKLSEEFKRLAGLNVPAGDSVNFLGGGAYDHYIPAAISHLLGRSEFYTAYTPYQAEVAQGTLQTIYEFQTMICRLMAMDAANASHYDGATALAEGVMLAVRKTRRKDVAVPASLNPMYRSVLETYCEPSGIRLREIAITAGTIDLKELDSSLDDCAALIVQHPNYFGLLEPAREASEIARRKGALVLASTNPMSLALFEPPGEWGADICTGEGQPFGASLNLGGPYVGLFAVKQNLLRMMPGRLVAAAEDTKGRSGFVLTLQTREQHIRREKATSNICTNEALIALGALIYLSLVGRDGLKRAAMNSYRGAHYLRQRLSDIEGCEFPFEGEFFNEFVLKTPVSSEILLKNLTDKGYFAGPRLNTGNRELENSILVAVTEKRDRKQIDDFCSEIENILS